MTHVLVLGTDESDCLDSILASPEMAIYRRRGARITLVWPGALQRIADSDPFDKLHVTPEIQVHPEASVRENCVAACRTRVRGSDGKTPAERIGLVDQVWLHEGCFE